MTKVSFFGLLSFLLLIVGCQSWIVDKHSFFVIEAEKGYFIPDFENNRGTLILEDLDATLSYYTKDRGERRAGEMPLEQFVEGPYSKQSFEAAFVFYRDHNNDRVNVPLAVMEISQEGDSLALEVVFVEGTYMIDEVRLSRITLFLS